MGVKIGRSQRRRKVSWGRWKIGCSGEYLGLRGKR